MKKQIILLAIILLPAFTGFSQTISPKSSITISAGPSFPLGDFGNTNRENNYAGFSGSGINVSISFGHKLNNLIGLEAMVYGQQNALNTSAVRKNLSEASFLNQQPGFYSNWAVEKKHWQIGSFMVGVSGETSADNPSTLTISGKLLLGIAYIKSPDLKGDSRDENKYAIIAGKYGTGIGPAWLISPAINYQLNKHFKISLTTAYFGSPKISFKDATEVIAATNGGLIIPEFYDLNNSVNPPLIYGEKGTRKQSVESINVNLGVSFQW